MNLNDRTHWHCAKCVITYDSTPDAPAVCPCGSRDPAFVGAPFWACYGVTVRPVDRYYWEGTTSSGNVVRAYSTRDGWTAEIRTDTLTTGTGGYVGGYVICSSNQYGDNKLLPIEALGVLATRADVRDWE